MKWSFTVAVAVLLFAGCSTRDKYDVVNYHGVPEQDSVLTSIVAYIFTAPPYTSMNDRFKPEHRSYYLLQTPRFSIDKYFVSEDGTHYFHVIRPGPKVDEKRGVGGHFKMNQSYRLTNFREVFVTPLLTEEEVKKRGGFLFDEMVKGTVEPYLKMKMYVQWPNEISVYDTVSYQWKLKTEKFN
ncbi:MAG TPA: hypothetical protein VK517_13520 [Cyclobacteriaceae bacterium]|nr:hypothetical protein [Cyclobacteriaceae bacterium]